MGASFYRALLPFCGEILESDSFKSVYRRGIGRAKDWLNVAAPDLLGVVVRFERAVESDYQYVNSYGYVQRDIICQGEICTAFVTRFGHSLEFPDHDPRYYHQYGSLYNDGWKSERSVDHETV